MMDIASLIYELYDRDKTVLMILIYFGILAIAYQYFSEKKQLDKYFRACRWRICVGVVILGHILLILEYCSIITLNGICTWQFALVNVIVDISVFFYLRFVPSRVERKLSRLNCNLGNDLIKEHLDLQKLKSDHMTPKELCMWKREYYTNLFLIGSVNKAVEIMETVEPENSSRRRILYSLRAEVLGNVDEAREKMLKAMDALKPEDEKLRVQLYNDIARCDRFCDNNEVAYDHYNRAADLINSKTNMSVVHIVYSNLLIQSCIKGCSDAEIEQVLEQYKHLVEDKSLEDIIEYDNAALAVAREKNDIDKQKEQIEESYTDVYAKLLKSDRKKAISYNVSHLKMAHMLQMELGRYMDAVRAEWDCIQKMQLPDKYYVMKELFIVMIEPPEVHPQFIGRYQDIFSVVDTYIKTEAADDLERYESEIPIDAVYARGKTLQELAWLQKWKSSYDFDTVISKMKAAIDLYNSQSLRLEAIIMSGNLIDELVSLPNINQDFSVKYPDILETELGNLASQMECVRSHAGVADVYLKIAYGYIYICNYKEADKYYQKFLKCRVNPNHFSVWMKANLHLIEVTCKLWRIKRGIVELKRKASTDISLSKQAKDWLAKYPQVSTEEMVVLLAIALNRSYVSAKVVSWGQETQAGILIEKHHWWLLYGEDGPIDVLQPIMEVDLCYDQISDTGEKDQIIFFPEMHPLQARNRQWVLDHVNNLADYQVRLEIKNGMISSFNDDRAKPIHEIGKRLQKDSVITQ